MNTDIPRNTGPLAVRSALAGMLPYAAPQLSATVRLNTNESPYPPPAELMDDIAAAAADAATVLHRYPERGAL